MKKISDNNKNKWLPLRYPADGGAEVDQIRARQLQLNTVEWCRKYFLEDLPHLEKTLAKLDSGLFSVLVYPGATKESAQFLSDFMAWWFLLDDMLECKQNKEVPEKKRRALFRSYISSLQGNAVAGEIEDCFVLAARELGRRLPQFACAEFVKRFCDSMKSWLFKGIEKELVICGDPSKSAVESYFQIRPFSSGVLPTLYLAELASAKMPLEKIHSQQVGDFLKKAGRVIYLGNDIFSYHKEAKGGCNFNLAAILQREQSLSETAAISECARYHNEAVAEYIELKGELREPPLGLWLQGIDNVLAGLIEWQNSALRYGAGTCFWQWI
ncbi:MAG: terpene synthase family protein [bacterium]|nr:terpene synthase family protein [bacterium]